MGDSVELGDRKETVRRLLEAARQNRLSGLQDMLRIIAEFAGAFGAVMWEVAPGANLAATPPEGRLFVLGSWFQDPDVKPWYYLAISDSLTGHTILAGVPKFSPLMEDEELTPRQAKDTLRPWKIKSSLNVPLELHQSGVKASINIHWQSAIALTDDDTENLAWICSFVPHLYASLVDGVGLNLIHSVDRILRKKAYSAKRASSPEPSKSAITAALNEVVKEISNVFDSRETSIFLSKPSLDPDVFRLEAFFWDWESTMVREEHRPGMDPTGYALKTAAPVRILDLSRYKEDQSTIQNDYPGLEWKQESGFKEMVRSELNYSPDADLPPLSFMAVPVISDGQLRGVIRCCTRHAPPYFFDDRQVGVLQLAAGSVAAWWENWLDHWETERENSAWEEVIKSVGSLNGLVHSEMTKNEISEAKIFQRTMEVASKLIEDSPACDIRLKDSKSNSLYIAETYGALWEKGGAGEVHQRKARMFPLDDERKLSAAAYVYKTRKRRDIEHPASDPYYDPTFPEVKQLMLAPLLCGSQVYGTLGIRRVTDVPFAAHAKVVVDLLANQLGLYHFLADKIKALKGTEKELQKNIDSQRQRYEDFQHQVRSPIVQASRSIQDIVDSLPKKNELTQRLLAVKGLCAQAERVARNLEMFVALGQDKPISLRPKVLTSKQLVIVLTAASRDHQAVMPAYRNIRFQVEESGFSVLDRLTIKADMRLLEQVVNNILDNASKYSYPNTNIRIWGGLMENATSFFISVANQGLVIRGDEIKEVLTRGGRAESARSSTADGQGIGLWIVSKIVEAHSARLMIIPTTPQGVTEVRVVFPKGSGVG